MKQFSVPLLGQLATIVSGDLEEAVASTVLDTWQETLALILTYAKEQEFVPLCQQLGSHMENLGDRDAALLCVQLMWVLSYVWVLVDRVIVV